jgi:hypothetical protein
VAQSLSATDRASLPIADRPLPDLTWPRRDDELSRFFGYLSLTHTARWQVAHDAVGTGHVYQ